ncbi:MAG: RNA methyltransferase [Rhodospirillales bacterium]|nr:RNA methyltransferase [Rhodospirillales bacterium]
MTGDRVREISSPTNPLIKDIRALHMRKARAETGLFVAEGARTVREALDHGVVPEMLAYRADQRDQPAVAGVRKAAGDAGALLLEVSAGVLEKISQRDNPQSVIGVFRQRVRKLSELDPAKSQVWLALEGVKDPGNLGTCVRTADAVGAGGVILIGNTCDPFSPEAVRATMGSIFAVPLYAADTAEAVAFVRGWPGTCVGTALQTDTDYRTVAYSAPTLIVNGTEQSGLGPEIRAACGKLVRLPMRGRADSLNLSVAAGIMLYAVWHRLEGSAR